MAFINEYVAEEDIKKYKLKEAAYRYNPLLLKSGLPPDWKPMWTIDRDRDFFLKEMRGG